MQPTVETLKDLSPGACKLLWALYFEPTADQARCAELTGYTRRQIRNLSRELQNAAPPAAPRSTAELSPEQCHAYGLLFDFGYDVATARTMASQYPTKLIKAGIAYVGACQGVKDERAMLIVWLRRNVPHADQYDGSEFSGQAAYRRVWDRP